jgi:hypothetical protein
MNRSGVRRLLGATAKGLVPPFAGRRRRRRGKGLGTGLAMLGSSILPSIYNDVKGLFRRKRNNAMVDPEGGRRRRRRRR